MSCQIIYEAIGPFRVGWDMDSGSFFVMAPDGTYMAFTAIYDEALQIARDLATKETARDNR